MGSVSVQHVTKQFGGQLVLRDVCLDGRGGETIGVTGANGAGKTTLFRVMAGLIQPDEGTVTASKGMQIGYLPQEPVLDSARSLHDEVAGAFAPLLALEHRIQSLSERIAHPRDPDDVQALMAQYDRASARFIAGGGYVYQQKLDEVLGGLGFSMADRSLPVSALSGGQKCRAALARLLLEDRQYLLLDEPTNHLDLDAVRWLERFLAGHHGGAMIVSHDRYLLDRLATRIVEIDAGRATVYKGNYSTYVKSRAQHRLTRRRQFQKDAAFIAKERDFIARQHAGQRNKEARGRRTRLERRIAAGEFVMDEPSAERTMEFEFDAPAPSTRTELRAEALAKAYGDKRLFSDLHFSVDPGGRLGITGPNGSGKTTLLRILLGETSPDEGRFEPPPDARLAYYAQDATDLVGESTVIAALEEIRPDMSQTAARSFLGRFGFTGDEVFKRLGHLSGGEQSRLRLIKLLLSRPNFLILDEPTNHLDVSAREALEETLSAFPGTIIAVSHDRYFLDRIVDRLLVIRPTGHDLHPGNYSSYIEKIEAARRESTSAGATRPEGRGRIGTTTTDGRDARTASSRRRDAPRRPSSRYDSLAVEEIEALIIEGEEHLAEVHARFADPAVYKDAEQRTRLHQELEQVKTDLAILEEAWLDRADT